MIVTASKLLIPMLMGFIFSGPIKNPKDANHPSAYAYLDKLAVDAGTDKSSAFHDYTKIYAQYLDALKTNPIKFLEIGIYKGNSVKLWESYFPKAELHFIDIEPTHIEYQSTRSHYHFINQGDSTKLDQLAQSIKGDFDVIIDDGGHQAKEQIICFQTLFPYLKSGGLYIIEDLHAAYVGKLINYGKICIPTTGSSSCMDYLKNLLDDLNYATSLSQCADSDKLSEEIKNRLTLFQSMIATIHFYPSLCIIVKK